MYRNDILDKYFNLKYPLEKIKIDGFILYFKNDTCFTDEQLEKMHWSEVFKGLIKESEGQFSNKCDDTEKGIDEIFEQGFLYD